MAKFWLEPVALAYRGAYDEREIRRIERLVNEHQGELRAAWDTFFSGSTPAK